MSSWTVASPWYGCAGSPEPTRGPAFGRGWRVSGGTGRPEPRQPSGHSHVETVSWSGRFEQAVDVRQVHEAGDGSRFGELPGGRQETGPGGAGQGATDADPAYA